MSDNSDEIPKKRRRGPGRPFVPGVSYNPGGRPKKPPELRARCSAMTDKILARLEKIIDHGDDKDAVSAAKLVWAYAYGNPTTLIAGDSSHDPIEIDLLTPALQKLVSDGE